MFRPCIDLHEGRVKQIVGGTLDTETTALRTNFVSEKPCRWYADLYRQSGLLGGHVIKLGGGNDAAAREALSAFSGGMQIGGGVNVANAAEWLDAGASHVIVTSWVFREGRIDWGRLKALEDEVGRSRLVLDLSCRKRGGDYFVVTDRWRTFTDEQVCEDLLKRLSQCCAEFLVHAADVEGLCGGIDEPLVELLASSASIPVTYAGGAKSLDDLRRVTDLSGGRVDLTIGSALDIFGGSGVSYAAAVEFNREEAMRQGSSSTA